MAKIPDTIAESPTVQAIYAAYVAKAEAEANKRARALPTRRLGASAIGHPCGRKLWLDFRCAGAGNAHDGRTLRLFETGNLAESRFADNLRAIGCEIHVVDPETGQQFEYTAVGGHFVDKMDGAVVGIPEAPKAWHACEFKTHNAKSFRELKHKGVKASKPEHYAQIVVAMHLSGLKRGLYLAVNKDTDELYAERFREEETRPDAVALLAFAETIITAKSPPARAFDDVTKPPCAWCPYKEHCYGTALPSVTCRSCVHATPVVGTTQLAVWQCDKHKRTLTESAQARACDDHLFVPDTVPFATAVDAGYDAAGDWVEYQNADGTTWRNTKQSPGYKSVELTVLPPELIGAGEAEDVKQVFGGAEVVGVE